MQNYQNTSKIIGILFLFVFATSLVGSGIVENIVDADDYLNSAFPNKTTVIMGILIHLLSGFGTIGIAVIMFPILKKQSIRLAIGYLLFRSIEVIFISITELGSLSILTLSEEYLKAGATADLTYFKTIGTVIGNREWSYYLTLLFFGSGSIMFYFSMYKSKIIPKLLSLWGIYAGFGVLSFIVLSMLGVEMSTLLKILLAAPIALNEIVLSIYLIIKGFDSTKLVD